METFLDNRITLHSGNCLDVLATLEEESVDSVVTDPPYHLTSIVKRFGAENAAPAKPFKSNLVRDPNTLQPPRGRQSQSQYGRLSRGFMGKQWDGGEIAFEPETWTAVMRVLKPGGHLLAFGAPKNFGFMQYAIAQAGFEMRDVLAWVFGSGFPKSHNIGGGWGTALKPAYEPIIMARKPLIGTVAANVEKHGTGALNIDACRVEFAGTNDAAAAVGFAASRARGTATQSNSIGKESRDGTNTYDPFALKGRWPANVIHDGSDEVVGAFPEPLASKPGSGGFQHSGRHGGFGDIGPNPSIRPPIRGHSDEGGSAARFFYTAKADADDRIGSKHPTVKPIDLIQWLVRLVTPKGGTVLDPFAGTGTTGEAAWREGMNAILIEREEEYQADIRRRMALCLAGPDERARESIKAKTKDKPIDAGPLFGGNDTARGGADRFTATSQTRTNDRPGRAKTVTTNS